MPPFCSTVGWQAQGWPSRTRHGCGKPAAVLNCSNHSHIELTFGPLRVRVPLPVPVLPWLVICINIIIKYRGLIAHGGRELDQCSSQRQNRTSEKVVLTSSDTFELRSAWQTHQRGLHNPPWWSAAYLVTPLALERLA